MTDCTLQQKDSTEFPTITVAMENGLPRQHHMGVPCLNIVQLAWTNKKMTRVDTECNLQQLDSSNTLPLPLLQTIAHMENITQTHFTLTQLNFYGLRRCHRR